MTEVENIVTGAGITLLVFFLTCALFYALRPQLSNVPPTSFSLNGMSIKKLFASKAKKTSSKKKKKASKNEPGDPVSETLEDVSQNSQASTDDEHTESTQAQSVDSGIPHLDTEHDMIVSSLPVNDANIYIKPKILPDTHTPSSDSPLSAPFTSKNKNSSPTVSLDNLNYNWNHNHKPKEEDDEAHTDLDHNIHEIEAHTCEKISPGDPTPLDGHVDEEVCVAAQKHKRSKKKSKKPRSGEKDATNLPNSDLHLQNAECYEEKVAIVYAPEQNLPNNTPPKQQVKLEVSTQINGSANPDIRSKLKQSEKYLKAATAELNQTKNQLQTTLSEVSILRSKEEEATRSAKILQQEFTDFMRKFKILEREKLSTDANFEAVNAERRSLQQRVNESAGEAAAASAAAEAELRELRERISDVNNKLTVLSQAPPAPIGPPQELIKARELIQALRSENANLILSGETTLEETKEKLNEIQEMGRRLASCESQMQTYCHELELEKQRTQEYATALNASRNELRQCREKERHQYELISSLKYQFAELSAEKQRLLDDMSQVRSNAERGANELHARLASLTGDLARSDEATRTMQQRADRLAEEVDRLHDELAAARTSELRWAARDQESAQTALNVQAHLEQEQKAALLKIAELTLANRQLCTQLDEQTAAAAAAAKAASTSCKDEHVSRKEHQATLDQLAELSTVNQQLQARLDEQVALRVAAVSDSQAALSAELAQLTATNQELQVKLEEAYAMKPISTEQSTDQISSVHQEEMTALREELTQLQSAHQRLQTQFSEQTAGLVSLQNKAEKAVNFERLSEDLKVALDAAKELLANERSAWAGERIEISLRLRQLELVESSLAEQLGLAREEQKASDQELHRCKGIVFNIEDILANLQKSAEAEESRWRKLFSKKEEECRQLQETLRSLSPSISAHEDPASMTPAT